MGPLQFGAFSMCWSNCQKATDEVAKFPMSWHINISSNNNLNFGDLKIRNIIRSLICSSPKLKRPQTPPSTLWSYFWSERGVLLLEIFHHQQPSLSGILETQKLMIHQNQKEQGTLVWQGIFPQVWGWKDRWALPRRANTRATEAASLYLHSIITCPTGAFSTSLDLPHLCDYLFFI